MFFLCFSTFFTNDSLLGIFYASHEKRLPMRYEKGHDINAACGQLRLRKLRTEDKET